MPMKIIADSLKMKIDDVTNITAEELDDLITDEIVITCPIKVVRASGSVQFSAVPSVQLDPIPPLSSKFFAERLYYTLSHLVKIAHTWSSWANGKPIGSYTSPILDPPVLGSFGNIENLLVMTIVSVIRVC